MAVVKQRLQRFNGSSYDTIHLETSDDAVLRRDGTTVRSWSDSYARRFIYGIHNYGGSGSNSLWFTCLYVNSYDDGRTNGLLYLGSFYNNSAGGSILVGFTSQFHHSASYGEYWGLGLIAKGGTPHFNKMRVVWESATRRRVDIHYAATGANTEQIELMTIEGTGIWEHLNASIQTTEEIPSGQVLLASLSF